jgi:histidine phosphotransferase ChpT
MAELGESVRLVELICARLCHDLGGLTGTVGNALEMVADDAGGASGGGSEVVAFASSAAKALNERLRLMRAAWGPETGATPLPELIQVVTSSLTARRIGLDTRTMGLDCVFPGPVGRVVLNLIVLASDCLPRGGIISLRGKPDDLLVRIKGPGGKWPPGFVECMRDEAAALAAVKGPRSVQMPLTVLFALSRNLRISPVLGPEAGIEAVRLEAG